jgi:cyclic beta-1,2-glucan synthetase
VVSAFDAETGSLHARNAWSPDFPNHVAFLALDVPPASFTADRTEFLGRNGRIGLPAGLAPGHGLSGRAGAGLDPCAALQAPVSLPPHGRAEIRILLGQAKDADEARRLVRVHRDKSGEEGIREVRRSWDSVLGGLQIKTPDTALDQLVNQWLLYQALSCRIWGRSAFYQSGGAFGFRDQLQDALALVVPRRDVLREQILRSASRQFAEGDVQHWWHPPSGKGVRTRMSDDLLWLPFAVSRYLEVTGDEAILEERVAFLGGDPLRDGEVERYFVPPESGQSGDVYEHCARALDRSLAAGAHGLPLMGTGDWNDGMNRVGVGGKGESVWLAWFLRANLEAFVPIAERRGGAETERASRWRERLDALAAAVDREAWDGDWYRRAFFDDGTPLGTSAAAECRIDSIAQSWAVIAGGGDPSRARAAMDSVDRHLVRRRDGLVMLFAPPFGGGRSDPGYIQGYPPGVRENGGQYTHGAVWSVIAFAALGDGDRAVELLSMLNPVHRTRAATGLHRYMGEPYVVAADVYSEPPHVGRCGWTWYTGSAGWMYRAAVEWILGLRVSKDVLRVDPCIPRAGRASRPRSVTTRPATRSRSRTRGESHAESPSSAATAADYRTARQKSRCRMTGAFTGSTCFSVDRRPSTRTSQGVEAARVEGGSGFGSSFVFAAPVSARRRRAAPIISASCTRNQPYSRTRRRNLVSHRAPSVLKPRRMKGTLPKIPTGRRPAKISPTGADQFLLTM